MVRDWPWWQLPPLLRWYVATPIAAWVAVAVMGLAMRTDWRSSDLAEVRCSWWAAGRSRSRPRRDRVYERRRRDEGFQLDMGAPDRDLAAADLRRSWCRFPLSR